MRLRPIASQQGERGFSYVMLMLAIVLMGIALSAAARQWKTMVQRELEADLLAKGIEIQNALMLYSSTMKAGRVIYGEVYPQTLVELTRQPKPFLRKVYLDPIGHGEWEIIRAPAGGIMGVRSKSKDQAIKQRDFPLDVRHFEGRPTYAEWIFQYPNASGVADGMQPFPGAGMQPSQPGMPQPGAANNLIHPEVGAGPTAPPVPLN